MSVLKCVCTLGLTMTAAIGGVTAPVPAAPAPSEAPQTALTPPNVEVSASTFDGSARKEIVAKLSDALRDDYIFPDVGEKAAEKINAALSAGAYDSLSDPNSFAERLSSDVAAVAHDKHLSIRSMGAPPPPLSSGLQDVPRAEAGITRADKLPGGIGYIEVIGLPPAPAFRPVVDKAMLALKGSRALIIDDRRNHGGSPDGVAYLVSFLVPPNRSTDISDIVSRDPKSDIFKRERFSSRPTPVSFARIPVYVLTSKNTFSGGEEFAYDVQTHKLGKVIGEVTGGGAHPTGPVDLGHGFVAMIPVARTENPITKKNWEGVGVQPDIVVPAQDALKVALQGLGAKPVADVAMASQQQVFAPRSTPLGPEATARRFIAGLVSGRPDDASMIPEFARFNHEQLPMTRGWFLQLGEFRSIKFEGAGMMGGDEYRVSFAKEAMIVDVMFNSEGKVEGAEMRPAPAGQ